MATPTGYTRISPGLYRDAKGATVRQSQLPKQQPVGAPVPKAQTPVPPPALDYGTDPYNAAMTEYRGLGGKSDAASMQRRRTLAGQIQAANKNRKPFPTGGGLTVVQDQGAGAGTGAGTDAGAGTGGGAAGGAPAGGTPIDQPVVDTTANIEEVPDQLTDEDLFQTTAEDAQGNLQQYVDPALLSRIMTGFETAGQWAPQTKMPTEQETGQFFNDIYSSTLADLNQGVGEMQQQRQAQREAELVNRGIPVGSEAYNREMIALNKQASDEAAQLRNEARNVANVSTQNLMNQAQQRYQAELQGQQQRTSELQGAVSTLTPLAGEQLRQAGELTKMGFDRETSVGLAQLNLNAQERNTIRSLNQSERENIRNVQVTLRKIFQDDAQFQESMKLAIRTQVDSERRWRKEFAKSIKEFKWLSDKDKRDFNELVRSNRAKEALQRLSVAAQGAGQDPAMIENIAKARVTGHTGGIIASIKQAGKEASMDADEINDLIAQTIRGGPSGIDFSVGNQ